MKYPKPSSKKQSLAILRPEFKSCYKARLTKDKQINGTEKNHPEIDSLLCNRFIFLTFLERIFPSTSRI